MTSFHDRTSQPEQAEAFLWTAFKSGNRKAFEKLLQRYYAILFRYASRFSKNRALVEDCLQDVLVYVWEHREGLGNPASVKFYLLKAVRNRMLLELKYRPEPLTGHETAPHSYEEGPEQHLIADETLEYNNQRLSKLMKCLPERQKEALYLKYFEGMKVEEIGEVMGVSRQSAANFLCRALAALRESWVDKVLTLFSISLLL